MSDKAEAVSKSEQRKLSDLVHHDWFKGGAGSSIWATAYRMFRVTGEEPIVSRIVDFGYARVIFVRGSLAYLDSTSAATEFISETEIQFDASQFKNKNTPEGDYALVLTPFSVDGKEVGEPTVRNRIREVVGLLGAHYGRNAVYQHLFDNIIEMATDQTQFFGPVIQNPNWFPAVDITDSGMMPLLEIIASISKLPIKDKNRVLLALRWFHYAQFDVDGVSSFIKFWIAIETLAMPDTSDIRPLNEALAVAYGVPMEEAKGLFQIGRVLNLRSKIVHDGLIVPIHGQLLRYVEAVFFDLLSAKTGALFKRRAEAVISDPACDLGLYLETK
jgi:hypothetical protein